MIIENGFDIGDIVYLKHDPEQLARMIVGVSVYKNGEHMYKMVAGSTQSEHYEFELSVEANLTIKTR